MEEDKNIACGSESYADSSYEPAALLGYEVGVHAAAVVFGAEQVVNIKS